MLNSKVSGNRLTVLVPCYNQGAYLRQCLDSILAQSCQPFQVIVSDNYSSDDTADILSSYRHCFTVVQPDCFLPATEHFNFLLSLASSEWAAFLCSDDWAKPDYVLTLSRLIARFPDSSVVRGGWHCVGENGKITSTRRLLSAPSYSPSPRNFFETIVGPKNPMIGWAVNLQKFADVGFFDVNADLLDWTAMITLSGKGAFATSHKPIAYYRLDYRPGIEERRILKQLNDCFFIADNYLLPRFSSFPKRSLNRYSLLLVAKIARMTLRYREIHGADNCYAGFVEKLQSLIYNLCAEGYIRSLPHSLVRMLPCT